MSRLQAVIGANYGDEGKGRCVDLLASRFDEPGFGVRYNSGAQAGHTVMVGEVRHVFSHFSSATLRDWTTLLTHKFVINPIIFNIEYDELEKKGFKPSVFIDQNCVISTPFDAFLNQLMESIRREGAHGSCGLGFGETIERCERAPETVMRASDVLISSYKSCREYVINSIESRSLDVGLASEKLQDVLKAIKNETFNLSPFINHWLLFRKRVTVIKREQVNDFLRVSPVIFEGAQGLLLHQDHPNFPHVTRSRTGLEDVVEVLKDAEIFSTFLQPWYCTRTYGTRHGAGPLDGEEDLFADIDFNIYDQTNVHNQWQGSLRYSRIKSLGSLEQRVGEDVGRAQQLASNVLIRQPNVMISCCDQVPIGEVINTLSLATPFAQEIHLGYGPDSAETEKYVERMSTMGTTSEDVVETKEPTAEVEGQVAPAAEVETKEAAAEE